MQTLTFFTAFNSTSLARISLSSYDLYVRVLAFHNFTPRVAQIFGRSEVETIGYTNFSTVSAVTAALQAAFPTAQIRKLETATFRGDFIPVPAFKTRSRVVELNETSARIVYNQVSFVYNITAPPSAVMDMNGNEVVTFTVRALRHKLFRRGSWTEGGDGGMFSVAPTVTATCKQVCYNATLSFVLQEFYNGEVELEITMDGTAGVSSMLSVMVFPVNQPATFRIPKPGIMEEGQGDILLNIFDVQAWPPAEDERQDVVEWSVSIVPPSSTPADFTGSVQHTTGSSTASLLLNFGISTTGVFIVRVRSRDNAGGNNTMIIDLNITVISVNNAPSFALSAPVLQVREDDCSGASGCSHTVVVPSSISVGPPDEVVKQNGRFMVTVVTGQDLFSSPPVLSIAGVLTLKTVPESAGTATLGIMLIDDGGTVEGGSDTSDPKYLIVSVEPLNDPPAFTLAEERVSVWENVEADPKPVVLPAVATGISVTYAYASPEVENEVSQQLTFTLVPVSKLADEIFTKQPSMSAYGDLSFSLNPYRFGEVVFNVTLSDSGGGSQFKSDVKQLTIEVKPINQPPSFSVPSVYTVLEDAKPANISAFAKVSAGAWGENVQNLVFMLTPIATRIPAVHVWSSLEAAQAASLSTDGHDLQLFEPGGEPKLDGSGRLTYRLKRDRHGKVRYLVSLKDDGGTERGGTPQAVPDQIMVFEVVPVNDAPSFSLPTLYLEIQRESAVFSLDMLP
jgi:hypothetical protein